MKHREPGYNVCFIIEANSPTCKTDWEAVPVVRAPNLEPGSVVGEFTIIGKLAEGGMGIVYAAEHPKIGKKAAVKVISPELCTNIEAIRRFTSEARAVNAIGHPNIVDIFSFGELDDGRNYFVMEWLQGRSLAERMAVGRLELDFALYILDQIVDAVDAAHEKDIVHRDLKPDNVFIVDVRGGRHSVKLLDFGIAKLTENGGDSIRTQTGLVMGTPGYISPEQARGRDVGFPADVYSLGAMAFELVTGRRPFVGDNAMDIVAKHLREPPPRCSDLCSNLPQVLDDLFFQTLSKDANARPSLSEIRTVIGKVRTSLAGGPTATHSDVQAQPASPFSSAAIDKTEFYPDSVAAIAQSVESTEFTTANVDPKNRSRLPWIILAVLVAGATVGALFLLAPPPHNDSSTQQSGASVDQPVVAPIPADTGSDKGTPTTRKTLTTATDTTTEALVPSSVTPSPVTPTPVTHSPDTAIVNDRKPTRTPPKRTRPVKRPKKTPLETVPTPPQKPVKKKAPDGDYTIDPFAQ